MIITDLIQKLEVREQEFVTANEIKDFCKIAGFQYDNVIKYLEEQKYLQRIFRGTFHVISRSRNNSKYNHLELVAKGLELKGVENWYCGLYTALKFNNMTHETFVIYDIISDSIFRQNPMTIDHHKFRFIKISKKLMHFGIKKQGMIKFSDPEKTILDFIYLGKYNGKSNKRIVSDVYDWSQNICKDTLKQYSKHYPKTIREIIQEILYER